MLSLPEPVKIFLCVTSADLRKSFDGLANLVREWLRAATKGTHRSRVHDHRLQIELLLMVEHGQQQLMPLIPNSGAIVYRVGANKGIG